MDKRKKKSKKNKKRFQTWEQWSKSAEGERLRKKIFDAFAKFARDHKPK